MQNGEVERMGCSSSDEMEEIIVNEVKHQHPLFKHRKCLTKER